MEDMQGVLAGIAGCLVAYLFSVYVFKLDDGSSPGQAARPSAPPARPDMNRQAPNVAQPPRQERGEMAPDMASKKVSEQRPSQAPKSAKEPPDLSGLIAYPLGIANAVWGVLKRAFKRRESGMWAPKAETPLGSRPLPKVGR